jgi:shikimate kinase
VKRHVVLVGLPGSGKSTVGALVAAALGCPLEDLDEAIVVAGGRPIATIFAELGEAAFRDFERQAMTRALARAPGVIVPGGGWAAQPGNLETAAGRALVVHLACSPRTAASRSAGGTERPLLAGDRLGAMQQLARERAAFYARAEHAVTTDGRDPQQVARAVLRLARSVGGW